MMHRRGLLTGLIAFATAAPAIVKVSNLMLLPRRPLIFDVRAVLADGRIIEMLPDIRFAGVIDDNSVFSTGPFLRPGMVTHMEANVGGVIVRKQLEYGRYPLSGDTLVGIINPAEWQRV